jgi:hypothetical protein
MFDWFKSKDKIDSQEQEKSFKINQQILEGLKSVVLSLDGQNKDIEEENEFIKKIRKEGSGL